MAGQGSGQGFSNIKEQGFISLLPDLREGPRWKDRDSAPYETPDATPPKAPLHEQPLVLVLKVRMIRALLALLAARGLGVLDILDADWDKAQRRFFHLISLLMLRGALKSELRLAN